MVDQVKSNENHFQPLGRRRWGPPSWLTSPSRRRICIKNLKIHQKGSKVLLVGSSNCQHLAKNAVGICAKTPKKGKKCCRYLHPKSEKSIKKRLSRDDDNSKVEHFCEAKVSVSKETCQSYRFEQKNPEKDDTDFLRRAICANGITTPDLKVR